MKKAVEIILANPRGFCAGVDRAIDIVEAALQKYGAPIYVRHEVVHNRYVVENLKQQGAVFVDEIDEVPQDSIVIFSAHGVSQAVREQAKQKNLRLVLDATCPLVTKVHMEVSRQSKKGQDCILIGHAGHAEVEGTLGQYLNEDGNIYLVENVADVEKLAVQDPDQLFYVTQTTLSVDETKQIIDALQRKFPNIQGPKRDDICYATQNRQDAVKALAKHADVILVVGSVNSSNSNRLKELAEHCGTRSYLIDDPKMLKSEWFDQVATVGVTAGASAPEILVSEILDALKQYCTITQITELKGIEENITFSMPKELRDVELQKLFKPAETLVTA